VAAAAQDDDTTATSGEDVADNVAEQQAAATQTSTTDRGRARAEAELNQFDAINAGKDPAQASLLARYDLNAQQARAILQRARDTLQQNAPQMINLAAAQGMSPAWTAAGTYAGAMGRAAGAQEGILDKLMGYHLGMNQADLGSLNAQLQLLKQRSADQAKIAPAAMRVDGLPGTPPAKAPSGEAQNFEQILKDTLGAKGLQEGTPEYQTEYSKGMDQFLAKQEHYTDPVAAAGAIPQDAKEMFYQSVAATGKAPSGFSRSAPVSAAMWAYVKQRADQDGNTMASMIANGNLRTSNSAALTQGMKQESAISSYYNTMDKNLTNLLDLSGKVDSTGSPLVNKVFRAWQQGVTGDPDVAKYVTYLNAVESEFAKIQSGAMGNQAVTDAQRKESKDTINKYMGPGTIEAVAEGMRGEGNNRLGSLHDQNTYLKQQLGIKTPEAPPTPGESSAHAGTTSPPANLLKEGVHTTFKNGQTWTLQGGKPVQVTQ
jgi:hypothetical protein